MNPRQLALDALLLGDAAAKCAAVDALPLPAREQTPTDPDIFRMICSRAGGNVGFQRRGEINSIPSLTNSTGLAGTRLVNK